jgi:hypothetical protein
MGAQTDESSRILKMRFECVGGPDALPPGAGS